MYLRLGQSLVVYLGRQHRVVERALALGRMGDLDSGAISVTYQLCFCEEFG